MSDFSDSIHTVAAEGAELYVEVVGPAGAPTLYYLHGGPGYSSYSFRDLVGEELLRYRVVYADQRGGGRSPAVGEVSLELLASDVVTVLDHLEVSETTLLAHGFGALVAATAAARASARIGKLILVNPWVDMALLASTLQREAALGGHDELALPPEAGEKVAPERLIEQVFGWVAGKGLFDAMAFPKPSSRLRLEHSDAEALIGGYIGEAPTGLWSLSVRQLLPRLRQQTVVFSGQRDRTSYPDQVEVVLESMPHALVSLLDAGHYPWLDDPGTFVDLLHEAMRL